MLETAITSIPQVDGGNEVWIEALPARIFHTPQYGPVEVSTTKLQRMIKNFTDNVRGQEIAMDYDHGMDRAKGNQASGWFREFAIKPSSDDPTQASLFARVALTDEAAREVKDQKWKYFSLEWDDAWMDNDGAVLSDVIMGGALTNRPVAKKIMPINFSEALWNELDYDTKKEFSVWSTAFVNNLPDSAFLFVEPGKKDSEGKTTPRSNRHFPYKGPDGKIDLPHLRNAIARIPQAGDWMSATAKTALQNKARRMLTTMGKAMSEGNTAVIEAIELLDGQGVSVFDFDNVEIVTPTGESKELEHSEPGRGNPPPPRQDEDGSDDIAIRETWRIETPPIAADPPANAAVVAAAVVAPVVVTPVNDDTKGGSMTPEQEFELRNVLGIATDANIIDAARLQLGELTELKRTVDAATQERKFSEEYPAFWGEHSKLMTRDRENTARTFSETVSRVRRAEGYGLKETAKGLSSMCLTKVKDLHVKFSENKATVEDFEDCIRSIVNGGIVEFGEVGTSASEDVPLIDTTTANGIAGARKLFGEVVAKIQKDNTGMSFRDAYEEASKKHPDLAEAYSVALPG